MLDAFMIISISNPNMYCECYETKSEEYENEAIFVYSFHFKSRKRPLIPLYRFLPMGFLPDMKPIYVNRTSIIAISPKKKKKKNRFWTAIQNKMYKYAIIDAHQKYLNLYLRPKAFPKDFCDCWWLITSFTRKNQYKTIKTTFHIFAQKDWLIIFIIIAFISNSNNMIFVLKLNRKWN